MRKLRELSVSIVVLFWGLMVECEIAVISSPRMTETMELSPSPIISSTITQKPTKTVFEDIETKQPAIGALTPSRTIEPTHQAPVDCYNVPIRSCLDNPLIDYVLGLAYDLNGRRDLSEDIYLKLWEHFPEDPYSFMAKKN